MQRSRSGKMRTNRTEYLFSVNTHAPPTKTVDCGDPFTVEVTSRISARYRHRSRQPATGIRWLLNAGPIVVRDAKLCDVVAIDCCLLSECADSRSKRGGQQQPHRWAHRKIRVAARPRALRPAWSVPHLSISWRVSAVATSGGVSMRSLLVGMMMKIV